MIITRREFDLDELISREYELDAGVALEYALPGLASGTVWIAAAIGACGISTSLVVGGNINLVQALGASLVVLPGLTGELELENE